MSSSRLFPTARAQRTVEPFVVCAMPRSRTAWMANFLCQGRIRCGHELGARHSSPAAIARAIVDADEFPEFSDERPCFSGAADTGAAWFMDELLRHLPAARLAVIIRPPEEVMDSFVRMGLPYLAAAVPEIWRRLKVAALRPSALVLKVEELGTIDGLRALQSHVAPGTPFNEERARMLMEMNVQLTPVGVKRALEGARNFQL